MIPIHDDLFRERYKEYQSTLEQMWQILKHDTRGDRLLKRIRRSHEALLTAHRKMILNEVRLASGKRP